MLQEKYNIYILDDDQQDAELLKSCLQFSDYSVDVRCFTNENKLLQELYFLNANELPHLILIDDQKPQRDQSTLLHHIRGDKKLKRVLIGIYSADIQKKRLVELFASGIDFFIAKANNNKEREMHVKEFLTAIKERYVTNYG
jgi:CheY-like chemotaxis protein